MFASGHDKASSRCFSDTSTPSLRGQTCTTSCSGRHTLYLSAVNYCISTRASGGAKPSCWQQYLLSCLLHMSPQCHWLVLNLHIDTCVLLLPSVSRALSNSATCVHNGSRPDSVSYHMCATLFGYTTSASYPTSVPFRSATATSFTILGVAMKYIMPLEVHFAFWQSLAFARSPYQEHVATRALPGQLHRHLSTAAPFSCFPGR
jgi:hypothetical protein